MPSSRDRISSSRPRRARSFTTTRSACSRTATAGNARSRRTSRSTRRIGEFRATTWCGLCAAPAQGTHAVPRFTVLLPTHNRADVIAYSIRSILAQTERDFELFVVGDGCTDGTAEVVAAFGDPRVHWFDLPKAPHSGYANRNIALRHANGEFIAYAQHDDLMFADHLARFREVMESAIAWAYSRPLWVTTDGIVV